MTVFMVEYATRHDLTGESTYARALVCAATEIDATVAGLGVATSAGLALVGSGTFMIVFSFDADTAPPDCLTGRLLTPEENRQIATKLGRPMAVMQ